MEQELKMWERYEEAALVQVCCQQAPRHWSEKRK